MGSLTIIKSGMMTSIQDFGRNGLAYFAIPKSGVMDENAARIAQLILHKDKNWPLIECTSSAPEIQFNDDIEIAISGADFNWKINNKAITINNRLKIKAGDILKGQFARNGLRGYIAIESKLEIPSVYNSFSTYTNAKMGGFEGRLLQKGDILFWKTSKEFKVNEKIISIKKGPEFDFLTPQGKLDLEQSIFKIGIDSNRMGIRLEGTPIKSTYYQLDHSLPVLPGFIQLPPNGNPIVVLNDGQTTGGYPRVAYVQSDHLSKLNQIPLGGKVKFKIVG